jgi:hypothetical protein
MGWKHNDFWTETLANYLSRNYFGVPYHFNPIDFTIRDIDWFNYLRLKIHFLTGSNIL